MILLFTANYYRCWFANSITELKQDMKNKVHANTTRLSAVPLNAYSKQELTIDIPDNLTVINHTIWMGLTAIDAYDRESNSSNMISIRYMPEVVEAQKSVSTQPNIISTVEECPEGTVIRCLDDMFFYIIIGVVALILLILLLFALCLCKRRRRRHSEDRKDLHNLDSPTSSEASGGIDGFVFDDEDPMRGDLALQDDIAITNEQALSYSKNLPSTKKRSSSLRWTQSLKRLSRKKAPIPTPVDKPVHPVIASDMQRKTTKQNNHTKPVWMSAKDNKPVPLPKPALKQTSSGVENVQVNRPTPKQQKIDETTMESDIQVADELVSDYMNVRGLSKVESSHDGVETPDVQL